jgi:hypothetical protein
MPVIRQIIYASQAVTAFPPATLLELLTFCRKSNPKAGLTGLLVFRDNTFLQLLEGPPEQVTRVYGSISTDPRHRDLELLVDRQVEQRSFPDWSMGFEEVNEVALNSWPGLSHVLQPPRTPAEWASQPDLALAFFNACHEDFQLSRRLPAAT